jgi:NhaP-type Na+/H+ or K+/H+ antiporter
MCLANWLMLTLFFGSVAGLSLSGFRQDFPALSVLLMTAVLGAAMAVPMRLMKMAWRPTLEMAGTSVAAGVVLIAGFWLGLVPEAALIPAACGAACVAMIAVMLFRLPLYASSHADHVAAR